MKNLIKVCTVLCVLFGSGVAMGTAATWTNGAAPDQDWFNGANRTSVAVPNFGSEAHLNTSLPAAIVDATGIVNRVVLDGGGSLEILASGDLTIIGSSGSGLMVGSVLGSTGTVVVDGTSLLVAN